MHVIGTGARKDSEFFNAKGGSKKANTAKA
jgi:hypothetical protein